MTPSKGSELEALFIRQRKPVVQLSYEVRTLSKMQELLHQVAMTVARLGGVERSTLSTKGPGDMPHESTGGADWFGYQPRVGIVDDG